MDVILVDEHDNPVGTMGKMEVHEKAILHRAFSIFIFNDKGEMLLQKRAAYQISQCWFMDEYLLQPSTPRRRNIACCSKKA